MQIQNSQFKPVQVVVIGNVAFDVLCYPVEDVPRYRSMTFDQYEISPGGCGSNTAIGLAYLKIRTALIASIGDDLAGELAITYWQNFGVQTTYIQVHPEAKTGVSIGLVDRSGQPRFVHTSGANALLEASDCGLITRLSGVEAIHIAGYFLLPGLFTDEFPQLLSTWQQSGVLITMDVAQTPRMENPEPLWKCLPFVDVFFCNELEAELLTGKQDREKSAACLLDHQVGNVIIKLGAEGCLLVNKLESIRFQGIRTNVIDTTGAGDAFAAGFISDYLSFHDLVSACKTANQVGAKAVSRLGALAAWKST